LGLDYVPTILGFNPMTQFIHEADVAEAIALALKVGTRGVFNVVGPGAVPLKVAIRESGGTPIPIPETLARIGFGMLFRFGLSPLPPGTIDFAKYASTVDGSRFRAATGFRPLFTLRDIFASTRR
jgi:UDP-glucose 4-epimerase